VTLPPDHILALAAAVPVAPFRWRDGDRTVVFGRGILAAAAEELLAPGYVLLISPSRARNAAGLIERARGALRAATDRITADIRL